MIKLFVLWFSLKLSNITTLKASTFLVSNLYRTQKPLGTVIPFLYIKNVDFDHKNYTFCTQKESMFSLYKTWAYLFRDSSASSSIFKALLQINAELVTHTTHGSVASVQKQYSLCDTISEM